MVVGLIQGCHILHLVGPTYGTQRTVVGHQSLDPPRRTHTSYHYSSLTVGVTGEFVTATTSSGDSSTTASPPGEPRLSRMTF